MAKRSILTAFLLFFCLTGAFAQGGHYSLAYPPRPAWQTAIQEATHGFWSDLGLTLRGKYKETQAKFRAAAQKTAEDVAKNPYKYFAELPVENAILQAAENGRNIPLKDLLQAKADAAAKQAADTRALVERYNQLVAQMNKNVHIWSGYAITGKINLLEMSDENFEKLSQLLGVKEAYRAPKTKWTTTRSAAGDIGVIVQIDDSFYFFVNVLERQVLIFNNPQLNAKIFADAE